MYGIDLIAAQHAPKRTSEAPRLPEQPDLWSAIDAARALQMRRVEFAVGGFRVTDLATGHVAHEEWF